METKDYYLGLDIGTDSVGYAVTDKEYNILKFRGKQAWGSHLFEAASLKAERRTYRSARRRLDRRKQRVELLQEIFAKEINKVDPRFYIRLRESMLFRSETEDCFTLFCDKDYTDKDYHKQYPTIHHLILDLMNNENPQKKDPRLVYIAISWLITHRGHFLSNVDKRHIEDILDFENVYKDFDEYIKSEDFISSFNKENDDETETVLPVRFDNVLKNELAVILKEHIGVTKKEDRIKRLYDNIKLNNIEKNSIKLLAGGTISPAKLFEKEEYDDVGSFTLSSDDEKLAEVFEKIGDDAELIIRLKAIFDWAVLADTLNNQECISAAKVAVYEQHKADLKELKTFVKKYLGKDKYTTIFNAAGDGNYVSYSAHTTKKNMCKKSTKEVFCEYIRKLFKDVKPSDADKEKFDSMMERLNANAFMPKQKDTDNRVLPYQLYWHELNKILDSASAYLPFLNEKTDGISAKEKILSIFEFKIPYFVGPLNNHSKFSWIVRREEGKIYPWNFEKKVDFDASEDAFIKRMTNTCTYLPKESVLPKDSLLYKKYTVLNEINNLKVCDKKISVELKQAIYKDLFENKSRVTPKAIVSYLVANNYYSLDDANTLSGIDENINSNLKTYLCFKPFILSKKLSESDVEKIIERSAYCEEKSRLKKWLKQEFKSLSEEEINTISRIKIKEFGRLSSKFLNGLEAMCKDDGELWTIIRVLWETNLNLMQIINSEKYDFKHAIAEYNKEYYSKGRRLEQRLDDMYVSNAVKRPIIRTLDVVKDVTKAFGGAPRKIFVEMARGASAEQKNKRTRTRKDQILDLYKSVEKDDVKDLMKQIEGYGDYANNKLQSEKLFLYYMQLGKCAYSGEPIDINQLGSNDYCDIDHIWPQRVVKDDSILNNKVLCKSEYNGKKSDKYPVPSEWRTNMFQVWEYWRKANLITEEKFKRLTRKTPFTDDELYGFINRQLVETRQSTKVIAELLQEKFPNTEIVYVKAGLVSEFRHTYDLIKSRSFNDLHHAKDAYLNVVVGNVYNSRFTKDWFLKNKDKYSMKTENIFKFPFSKGNENIWNGEVDVARVKKSVVMNSANVTKYSFCRKGGYFDQMPVKAGKNITPLKKGLDPEKYGGYNKATASYFVFAKYKLKGKYDVMLVPIELLFGEIANKNDEEVVNYIKEQIESITGNSIESVSLPMGKRKIKVNTVFSMDGYLASLGGKATGGKQLIFTGFTQFKDDYEVEKYLKRLESFLEKTKKYKNYVYDEMYDAISREQNIKLYQKYMDKMNAKPYCYRPSLILDSIKKGYNVFEELTIEKQAETLINIQKVFECIPGGIDLSNIKGPAKAGAITLSSKVSNWRYNCVKIIDQSASGFFDKESENILELL